MSGMNIVEKRAPQDGQFSTDDRRHGRSTSASPASPRCSARRSSCESARQEPVDDRPRTSSACRARRTYTYSKMVHAPFGMVICAGPTGAGKTTTLYATLQEINSTGKNVTTIEDPVEYVFPGINQIQTNEQAGLTFATGLKAILRQDPDVILVGEIRDADTARIAVQSALTGHFVLSSLHGTDSRRRAAPLPRHGHRGLPHRLGRRRRGRRSACCAASATTARSRTRPTADELAVFRQHSGGSDKTHVLPRRRLQLLRRHRLPRPHRRLRAAAHHARAAPPDRRLGNHRRAPPPRRRPRHAHDAARSHGSSSRTTSPPFPKSSRPCSQTDRSSKGAPQCQSSHTPPSTPPASTIEGVTKADTDRRRALVPGRAEPVSRSRSRRRRGMLELRADQGEGQEEGADALHPPAGGVREGRHPDHRGADDRSATRPTDVALRRAITQHGRATCATAALLSRGGRASTPRCFPNYYIGILQSAELTGQLDETLDEPRRLPRARDRDPLQGRRRRSSYPVRRHGDGALHGRWSSPATCCRSSSRCSRSSTPTCRCRRGCCCSSPRFFTDLVVHHRRRSSCCSSRDRRSGCSRADSGKDAQGPDGAQDPDHQGHRRVRDPRALLPHPRAR